MNPEERILIAQNAINFVNTHNTKARSTFAEKQFSDGNSATLICELNKLNENKINYGQQLERIKKEKEKLIQEHKTLLEEQTNVPNEFQKQYDKLIEMLLILNGREIQQKDGTIVKVEGEIQKAKKEFDELYNTAKQFYRIREQNGKIAGLNDNTDDWKIFLYEKVLNNENGTLITVDKNGILKYEYTNTIIGDTNNFILRTSASLDTSDELTKVLEKIRDGAITLENSEWEKLIPLAMAVNPQFNQHYKDLFALYMDDKFRYNIDRDGLNISLVDIRNSKNFRAADNSDAQITTYYGSNSFFNPTKMLSSNASKSFYMSKNDFYWSLNYNKISGQFYSIQNIILNLYQPILQYNTGKDLFSTIDTAAGKGTKALLTKLGMGDFIQNLAGYGIGKAVEAKYNNDLNEFSKNPSALYSSTEYEKKSNPMYYIEKLFNGGKWLNTYELPFVSNGKVKNEYLQNSIEPGEWNIGGLIDKSGGLKTASQTILHDRINLSLPTSPTFAVNNPHNATLNPFNIDFYLINKDDNWLDKNFQFMQALFAGTQWVTMLMGAIAASNVYHVLVPGRFMIQWATLLALFLAIGKLRTNQWMYTKYNQTIKMILLDTLWPEAWQVKLTIKPLTPWNFNTHMAYYLHGFGSAQKSRLYEASKDSILNKNISLKNLNKFIAERNLLAEKLKNFFAEADIFSAEDYRRWWLTIVDWISFNGGERNNIDIKFERGDISQRDLDLMWDKLKTAKENLEILRGDQENLNASKREAGYTEEQIQAEDAFRNLSITAPLKAIEERAQRYQQTYDIIQHAGANIHEIDNLQNNLHITGFDITTVNDIYRDDPLTILNKRNDPLNKRNDTVLLDAVKAGQIEIYGRVPKTGGGFIITDIKILKTPEFGSFQTFWEDDKILNQEWEKSLYKQADEINQDFLRHNTLTTNKDWTEAEIGKFGEKVKKVESDIKDTKDENFKNNPTGKRRTSQTNSGSPLLGDFPI